MVTESADGYDGNGRLRSVTAGTDNGGWTQRTAVWVSSGWTGRSRGTADPTPAAMTRPPLALTVDVEGVVESDDFTSVRRLDSVLETLSLPASLFVTPAVVTACPDVVRGWIEGPHAVGLHLHPGRFGGDSDWLATYDQSTIEAFLDRGTRVFERHLGVAPTCFRAGRWSFSEPLLAALSATGFDADASHRPGGRRGIYDSHGVTEFPMTVVGHPLLRYALRSTGLDGIPLHMDLLLKPRHRSPALYVATAIAAGAERPYLMLSLHDYDLMDDTLRRRVVRYVARLADWCRSETIETLRPSVATNRPATETRQWN